jgi:AcrR family transcriptional regulator
MPRPRGKTLDRKRVVAAALRLVDREGIDALSMRRLGRELGVEGMAMYTHVRHKSDLLDAIAELVLEELDTAFDRHAPWQERVRRAALAWADLHSRHPRSFPLVYRPSHGSHAVTKVTEELMDALRTGGFDERGAALAYQTIVTLIDGALLGRGPATDKDLQRGWKRAAKAIDPQRYPRVAEVAPQAATLTWREIIDSGLDLLLAGLEIRQTSRPRSLGCGERPHR